MFALCSVFVNAGSRCVRSVRAVFALRSAVFDRVCRCLRIADVSRGLLSLLCSYERVFACSTDAKVQHVQTMKKALLGAANIALDINEFDAASSNLRFHAHKMDTCEERTLAAHMLCHNHQNKLVEILMLKAIGYKLLMSLYSISLFLKMGGYFVRLVTAVRDLASGEH